MACKDSEEEARALLSETLQSFQTVQNEAAPTVERLSSLTAVEDGLAKIAREYPTTDVGLDLASRQPFGMLDPAKLPEIRATLETRREIETCADLPTVGCLRATVAQSFENGRASKDGYLIKAFQIAFDPTVSLEEISFSSDHERRLAATFAAIMAIAEGETDRVGAFLFDSARKEGIEVQTPRAAILYKLVEDSNFVFPADEGSLLQARIADMAVQEHTATGDPLASFLAGGLSDPLDPEALRVSWDAFPERLKNHVPTWIWIKAAHSNPTMDYYDELMTKGLSDFQGDQLSDAQATEIAIATIKRGRDHLKGEVLWHAAKYGIADAVLPAAEVLGGPFENRGYFAAAEGARELGYQGKRETFERILALTSFGAEQDAGTTMVENNYAFGQALAGNIAALEARNGMDDSVIELARILEGLPPSVANKAFNYGMDTRLWKSIPEEGLDRARLLAWPDAPPAQVARMAENNPHILLAGYEQARKTGRATAGELWEILNNLSMNRAEFIVAQIEDVAALAQAMDLQDVRHELLVAMMANRSVIEASLRSGEETEN
jgi:hypothetical protein